MNIKGFVLTAVSEIGRKAMLKDLNSNKKFFDVTTTCEDPLTIQFLLNTSAKIFMRKLEYGDFEYQLSKKMREYLAYKDVDYTIQVIE